MWCSRTLLRLLGMTLAGWLGSAAQAEANRASDTITKEQADFGERAEAVRKRLEAYDARSDEHRPTGSRLAQWFNFPNWPNYFNNWPNYFNNWGNFR